MVIELDLKKIGILEKFKFNIHRDDKGVSKELLEKGFREPHNSKYYYDFVEKEDKVLDIGSNLGYFTLLSKKAKKIICVEPLSKAIPILRKNIEENGLKNKCEVINSAVGKDNKKLILEMNKVFNFSKIVDKKTKNSCEVKTISLKDIVEKYKPNLLRFDLEGYEYELLLNNIPRRINKMAFEFHSHIMQEEKVEELLRYFDKEGFKIEYLITFFPKRLEKHYSIFRALLLEKFFVKIFRDINYKDALEVIKGNKGNLLIRLYSRYKLKKARDCYIFIRR